MNALAAKRRGETLDGVVLRQPEIGTDFGDQVFNAWIHHPLIEHEQTLELIGSNRLDAERLRIVLPVDQQNDDCAAVQTTPFDRLADAFPDVQSRRAFLDLLDLIRIKFAFQLDAFARHVVGNDIDRRPASNVPRYIHSSSARSRVFGLKP